MVFSQCTVFWDFVLLLEGDLVLFLAQIEVEKCVVRDYIILLKNVLKLVLFFFEPCLIFIDTNKKKYIKEKRIFLSFLLRKTVNKYYKVSKMQP